MVSLHIDASEWFNPRGEDDEDDAASYNDDDAEGGIGMLTPLDVQGLFPPSPAMADGEAADGGAGDQTDEEDVSDVEIEDDDDDDYYYDDDEDDEDLFDDDLSFRCVLVCVCVCVCVRVRVCVGSVSCSANFMTCCRSHSLLSTVCDSPVLIARCCRCYHLHCCFPLSPFSFPLSPSPPFHLLLRLPPPNSRVFSGVYVTGMRFEQSVKVRGTLCWRLRGGKQGKFDCTCVCVCVCR